VLVAAEFCRLHNQLTFRLSNASLDWTGADGDNGALDTRLTGSFRCNVADDVTLRCVRARNK